MSKQFEICESFNHKMIFEEDPGRCNISEVAGFLQCENCGATSDNIISELSIDGELISGIISKEDSEDKRITEDSVKL